MLAKRVCSVSKSENLANAGLIIDILQPFGSSCVVTKEFTMKRRMTKDRTVVANVSGEHNHGLRVEDLRDIGDSFIWTKALSCVVAL